MLINYNGNIVEDEKVHISADNRSFRYGDGCFETIKIVGGKILLEQLHLGRLFKSLSLLKFVVPNLVTPAYLSHQILSLVQSNEHTAFARVRLNVFRGEALLRQYDPSFNFIIQSWPSDPASLGFNSIGLITNLYPDAKKSADIFSALKTNNYLPSVMGSIWANEKGLDDCILYNTFNRISESTVGNVFIVENGLLETPPLSEGCVDGVMRRYLLQSLRRHDFPLEEKPLEKEDLLNASEVFFTNSLTGIRWVKKVGESNYTNSTSSDLYQRFIAPLFSGATF